MKGLTRNTYVQYESHNSSGLKVMAKIKVFKRRENFKVKVIWSKYPCAYESLITSGKKVMANVKVFGHPTNMDAVADNRAVTLAPRTLVLAC